MVLEVSGAETTRALAALRRAGRRVGQDAEAAVQALTWRDSDGDPVRIAQHALQRFLWYELTHKWIAPPDGLREVAEALAMFLDEVRAPSYAAICRSPETDRMIATGGAGWPELMEASGLEPPDTMLLEWGATMGFEEAELREEASVFLEGTIDRGELVPGAPGWRERQEQLMELFLVTPSPDGTRPLDVIHRARLDRWLGHPADDARRETLAKIVPLIARPTADESAARLALEPLLWLLERLDAGVALTQTGAFSRQFVREAVERYPGWWDSEVVGPPYREAEVVPLESLHDIVDALRVVRRSGRTLRATKRSREIRQHPTALLAALVASLATAEATAPGGVDVTLALLLHDPPLPDDEFRARLAAAVRVPVVLDDERMFRQVLPYALLGDVVGMLAPFDGIDRERGALPTLTEAGRIVAVELLRARATGPGELLL